ncbi:vomeronasal type-1 receptor 1-like [Macrotis lagotis]|uniref:vomeronasal type-1 receptor 1-like n=1 Tax=Macrotis lagotis TaxID=92651 RepID=UPI003D69F392
MIAVDILLSIAFFSQVGIGVQGNFFLIYLFSFLFFTGQNLRPIDLIIIQLALTNSLVLLSKGFLEGLAALGLKNLLDDISCKIVFYIHRVAWGLSLSITCLLSGFQAIIISPHQPRWIKLKARVPRYILPSILFFWLFHMLQNIMILQNLQRSSDKRNNSVTIEYGHCSVNVTNDNRASYQAIVFFIPDAMGITFISFTCSYKVHLLHKHHKRIQQVHFNNFSPRAFPEIRATQMILLLVSTFVTFYLFSSFLPIYMYSVTPSPWVMPTCTFLASCFPMVSPFMLIHSDSQILRYYSAVRGRKSPQTKIDSMNTLSLISTQALIKEKKVPGRP